MRSRVTGEETIPCDPDELSVTETKAVDEADDAHANCVYEVVKTHKCIPLVIHCIMDFDQWVLDQM